MIDGALHVEDAADLFERLHDPERNVGTGDADHAVTERSEDRLDDRVAHLPHRGNRIRAALADHGFGHRKSRLLQQRRGVELVHAALDRAGRVHHRDAAFLDPVERVDAVDDLFERARRNDSRQDGVRVEEGCAFAREAARRAAQAGDQALVRQHAPDVAARVERATELVGLPARARAQDDDVHRSRSG